VSKTVVVMLGVLCLVAGGAAFALVQVAGRLSADLHHSALALDALVTRLGAVEQDLANISDDVYAMADDVAAIADSLAVDEGDEGDGSESVSLRRPITPPSARTAVRIERVRAREARRARFASVAAHRAARASHPGDGVALAR
jgi:hypothetical protein